MLRSFDYAAWAAATSLDRARRRLRRGGALARRELARRRARPPFSAPIAKPSPTARAIRRTRARPRACSTSSCSRRRSTRSATKRPTGRIGLRIPLKGVTSLLELEATAMARPRLEAGRSARSAPRSRRWSAATTAIRSRCSACTSAGRRARGAHLPAARRPGLADRGGDRPLGGRDVAPSTPTACSSPTLPDRKAALPLPPAPRDRPGDQSRSATPTASRRSSASSTST